MINKIINFIKTHRNLYRFGGIIILLLILIISSLVTSQTKPKVVTPSTDNILPTPTPTVDPLLNQSQTLTITGWSGLEVTPPEKLPVYKITSPLVTSAFIDQVSSVLKFTSQDKQKTLLTTSYLWSNADRYLFASTLDQTLSYQLTTKPTSGTLPGNDETGTIAQNYLDLLFPLKDISFASMQKVNYLLEKDTSYLSVSTQSAGDYAEIYFSQVIDNYLVLGNIFPQGIISFLINREKQIAAIGIKGGFRSTSVISTFPTQTVDQIISTAPKTAKRIFLAAPDVTEEAAFAAGQLNLKLSKITLGYFPYRDSNVLEPVYILDGTLTGTELPATQTTYVVPVVAD